MNGTLTPGESLPQDGAVVLDTSVVIKWVRQGEVLAGRALALRDAYLDGQIVIVVPSLLVYEFANVLHFKGDLTAEQVQEGVGSLFDMGLEWALPSREVMGRAVEIAGAHQTTVYDATFVALAESLSAMLITADERLVHQLDSSPLVCFLGAV